MIQNTRHKRSLGLLARHLLAVFVGLVLLSLVAYGGFNPLAQRVEIVEESSEEADTEKPDLAAQERARIEGVIGEEGKLTDAESTSAIRLIEDLDSAEYDVRERAMRRLLFFKSGILLLLFDNRLNGSEDKRNRIRWLLNNLERGNAARLYIARLAALSLAELHSLESGGLEGFKDLLSRIEGEELFSEPSVVAYLFTRAPDLETAVHAIEKLYLHSEEVKALDIYQALASYEPEAFPRRRAEFLIHVAKSADVQGAVELLAVAVKDPAFEVRASVARIARTLRGTVDQTELLEFYRNSESIERKIALLQLVKLKDVDPSVREQWLALERDAKDELSPAFVEMACRENLQEIIAKRLEDVKLSTTLLSLLGAIGTPEHWSTLFNSLQGSQRIATALTWLPYSGLSVEEQQRVLLDQSASEDPLLAAQAYEVLRGYGSRRVVGELLKRWKENPTPLIGDVLSVHAYTLKDMGCTLDNLPSLAAFKELPLARLASALEGKDRISILRDLLFSPDQRAAKTAAYRLKDFTRDVVGAQLHVLYWRSSGSLRVEDISQLVYSIEEIKASLADDVEEQNQWALDRLLTLLVMGDESTLKEIEAGKYRWISSHRILEVLHPGEFGAKAREELLRRTPEELLGVESDYVVPALLAECGFTHEVALALRHSARARSLPARGAFSRDEWGEIQSVRAFSFWQASIAKSIALHANEMDMNTVLIDIDRHGDLQEHVLIAALIGLSARGRGTTSNLAALRRVCQTTKSSILIPALGAALVDPEYSLTWLQDFKSSIPADLAKKDAEFWAFLDALGESEHDRFDRFTSSERASLRELALRESAREGSVYALRAFMGGHLEPSAPMPADPFLEPATFASDPLPAHLVFQHLYGEPLPDAFRPWWLSTKYLWQLKQDDSGKFQLVREGDQDEAGGNDGKAE